MPPEAAHPTRTFSTWRVDNWWSYPLTIVIVFTAFVAYATFRVFENAHFTVDGTELGAGYHYLSPFGTPDLTFLVPAVFHSIPLVGQYMSYPAMLILPFPAGFRFTCYYYRKAYYRAFVARPAGCSTEAFKKNYRGETRLMAFQNLHRYFLYAALAITVFLAWDAFRSIYTPHGWYLGIGSVIMVVNVVLLVGYTLGCHALRHLVGGRADCFSCTAVAQNQHTMWRGVTRLNQKHGWWAMTSLFSVALTDLYIRWIGVTGRTEVWGLPA